MVARLLTRQGEAVDAHNKMNYAETVHQPYRHVTKGTLSGELNNQRRI